MSGKKIFSKKWPVHCNMSCVTCTNGILIFMLDVSRVHFLVRLFLIVSGGSGH